MRTSVLAVLFFAACSSHDAAKPDAAADAAADALPDVGPDAWMCPALTVVPTGAASELTVTGDTPAAGIFDPSIVYPAGASGGAMAYSAVPDQMTIRTHLAVSADGGATWTYVAEANAPQAASISSTNMTECPGGTCTGNLISEVTSLVYDPTDPDANTRWKLFAHRYLVGNGVALHYSIGTITLQTAPAPNGPWTAPAGAIGWTSPASYSSTGVATNASTLTSTADCLALTEPAALVLPSSIELAVGCVYLSGSTPMIRIELLRSVDHAATFQGVGTLVRPEDASCLTPGASINAPDLFVSGNTEYVAATPSNSSGYHGCLIYPIDDIAAGKIRRDAAGRALPARVLAPSPDQFSGACTFADGAGGYALDVGFLTDPRPFRIMRAGVSVP